MRWGSVPGFSISSDSSPLFRVSRSRRNRIGYMGCNRGLGILLHALDNHPDQGNHVPGNHAQGNGDLDNSNEDNHGVVRDGGAMVGRRDVECSHALDNHHRSQDSRPGRILDNCLPLNSRMEDIVSSHLHGSKSITFFFCIHQYSIVPIPKMSLSGKEIGRYPSYWTKIWIPANDFSEKSVYFLFFFLLQLGRL